VATLYLNRRLLPKGASDLRQLKGKRVGVSGPATITGFSLDVILSQVGLSAKEVELKSLSPAEAAAALIGGKLEAIVSTYLDRDLEALSPKVIKSIGLADVLPNYQYSFAIYGASLLDADDQAGARFLGAYLGGVREFIAGKTPRFLEEYAKANRLDLLRTQEACRTHHSKDGEIDIKSIELYMDWCVKRGYCPARVAPEDVIDRRFLAGARKWALQVGPG
jgi:NitT/TauT family transport system substrate-binding protein